MALAVNQFKKMETPKNKWQLSFQKALPYLP
jgi:hypothetical protein